MSRTTVTLTGTGVPHPSPGRAGPGVLVRHGDVAVQLDAGRATVLRLAEAGVLPHQLDALFVTHLHSDHLVDLADLVMTRWLQGTLHPSGPLPILAVHGVATRFAERMLDAYEDDVAVRMEHVQGHAPQLDVRPFALPTTPTEVWRSAHGEVVVEAMAVRHEPVPEAVAYRITAPDGVVVVSGDTRVCDEVARLADGADVLVHEACRQATMAALIAGTPFEQIFDYHADTAALGAMAEGIDLGHLMLTHLIPPPTNDAEEQAFADDVRAGGYAGQLTVGHDLLTIGLG